MPSRGAALRRVNNELSLVHAVAEADEMLTRLHGQARELLWLAQACRSFTLRLGLRLDDIKRVHRRVQADIAALKRGER